MTNPAIDNNIDAVLADYMRRSDAGETIDREAFVAAHPQVADDLREYFASVDDVERMAGPPLASTVQNGNRAAETHVTSVGDSVSEKPPRRTISADESKSDSLPETFGRYRIEKQLGRGAMGAVYLAHDTQLDRRVALKTPTFDATADAEMVERFYREARAAANLRHAGICPIFDVGKIDDTHYISMAYIEGKPMSALIDVDKPIPIRSVVSLVRKIALALDHAHNQGVIHRDLKPANIMIDRQKQPLIMDFGLARRVDQREQTRLTQDGMILGTPAYMSPEQVEGKLESGKQSDVYSLGVILYELLTGDLPFQGSVAAVIGQIMTQDAPAPSGERAEIDPALDAICQKMMARKLEDRYAGTKEAADALTSYLKGKASGRRQPAVACAEADAPNSRTSVKTDEGLETASRDESPAGKTRRDGTLTQLFSPWNRLPARSKVIATSVLAGLLLALMGLVVMLRTPYGTLRVEVGDPNVAVKVDGQTITLKDGIGQVDKSVDKHQLTVLVGETPVPLDEETIVTIDGTRQKVRLSVSGVELTASEFAVRRNGKTTISIQLERIKAPAIGVEPDGEVASPPIPDGPPGEVLVLPHGANDVAYAALSPNGKWILTSLSLTAKEGTKTHLWSTQTGRMVDSWQGVVQGGWLPDSEAFLTYLDNVVQLRTVQRPSIASQWSTGHQNVMSLPAFTPSGDQVLIGSWDRSLTISEVRTHKLLKSLKIEVDPPSRVDSVAISADGRTGYSYSPFADSSIRVWDLESGKLQKRIPVDRGGARGQFSSGGRRFLGFNRDRIFLIDIETERVVSEWTGSEKMNRAAAISPGGRYALTIGDDYVLRLWNGETAKLLHEFKGHTDYVHSLQFSNDIRFAVSASNDGTARVWRLPILNSELSLAPITQPINKPNSSGLDPQLISQFDHNGDRTKESYISILSPDASSVAYRMENDDPLRMFETATKKLIELPAELHNARSMDYNGDGSRFATGHSDGTVRIWNSETLEPVGQPFVTTAGYWVHWVSLSDDGKTVLALPTGQPTKFYGWEVESRKPLKELQSLNVEERPKGLQVATSADYELLAITYYNREDGLEHFVQIWDVKTGRPRDIQFVADEGSLGPIFDIDLSPRGDRLAVATRNNDCVVFDTASGKQTMSAKHGERVFSVRFSPDGSQLATCGGPQDSEDMHLWDAATGKEIVRWKLPRDAESFQTEKFGAHTTHLVYSRDGSQLLTAGMNTPVCVWKLGTNSDDREPANSVDGEPNDGRAFAAKFDQAIMPSLVWVSCRHEDGGGVSRLGVITDQRGLICISLPSRMTPTIITRIQDGKQYPARLVETVGTFCWVKAEGLEAPGIPVGEHVAQSNTQAAWLIDANRLRQEAPRLLSGEILPSIGIVSPKMQFPVQNSYRPVLSTSGKLLGMSSRIKGGKDGEKFILKRVRKPKAGPDVGRTGARELDDAKSTGSQSPVTPQTPAERQLQKLEETIFPWLAWVQAEGDKRKPLAVATAKGVCCVYPGGFKSVEITSLDETQKVAGKVGSRSPFPFCWIDAATPKATGIPLASAGAHRIAQPGLIVMRVNGKPELQLGQINADGTFTPEKPYNPPNRGVAAPGPIFNANGECLGYGVRSKRGSPITIYPLRRD